MDLIQQMFGRLLDRIRADQRPDGSWAGEMRSGMLSFYYAASLTLDGEPADSPVIQDLCDFTEACATSDGGLAIHPDEPADAMSSLLGTLLLGHARPNSPALVPARIYLRNHPNPPPRVPLLLLSRWLFEPQSRAAILQELGPAHGLRRLAMTTWPRLWSAFSYRKIFAQPPRPLPRPLQAMLGPMMRWMFWPAPGAAADLPQVLAPHMTLAICAPFLALRQLAGDRSPELEGFVRFARRHLADYRYDDGSVLYLNYLPSYIACAQASGDVAEQRLLSSGLRKIEHRPGGWLRGSAVATNTLDTAMTLRALLLANQSPNDPSVERAARFLRESQSDRGGWSWSWESSMGRRFRTADSDDTGAACVALLLAGEDPGGPSIRSAVRSLQELQTNTGGFNTFDIGPAANTVAVSNTSRALQALTHAGMRSDHPVIRKGCEWLLAEQEPNGKWVDYWVSRWIYGTVTALEALICSGFTLPGHPAVERGVNWLLRQQHLDGGWGERWHGESGRSTPEHTAMAIYGLCLGSRPASRPLGAISHGLSWLQKQQRADGSWEPSYVGAYSLLEGYSNSQLTNYWVMMALSQYSRMVEVPDNRVVSVSKLRKKKPQANDAAAE